MDERTEERQVVHSQLEGLENHQALRDSSLHPNSRYVLDWSSSRRKKSRRGRAVPPAG